jgi:hypothetical protein
MQKHELPLKKLLCLVTHAAPALSHCKNGVVGKLKAKVD